jgi:hypothetical protein
VARRVVIAADVPDGGKAGPNLAVRLPEPIPLRWVASVHVDDEGAVEDVRRAVEGAGPTAVERHELLWFATQELQFLVSVGP